MTTIIEAVATQVAEQAETQEAHVLELNSADLVWVGGGCTIGSTI